MLKVIIELNLSLCEVADSLREGKRTELHVTGIKLLQNNSTIKFVHKRVLQHH